MNIVPIAEISSQNGSIINEIHIAGSPANTKKREKYSFEQYLMKLLVKQA